MTVINGLTASPSRRWRRVILTLTLVFTCALVAGMQLVAPTRAKAAGLYQLLGEGLDSCAAPTTTQMAHFWNGSPYYGWFIYIGGDERSCSQPNLTKGWISTVTNGKAAGVSMNWKLVPIWVGPQDPCQEGFGNYISLNIFTAYAQGRSQANSAYAEWVKDLKQSTSTPIVYDMEYNGYAITSGCLAAMKSFINGWVRELHAPPAQKAGLYTSTGGDLSDFASIPHAPDFIWGANWSSGKSTADMPGVPSKDWAHQQRDKQYRGQHAETWHGTTLQVDSDCSNSWVYATFTVQNPNQGCA
jgi:hypothetical protein